MIVDGRRVTVPAGIGVDAGRRLVAALYTSDTSGIIHVDSDDDDGMFTLGQFFDEWQVALNPGTSAACGPPGTTRWRSTSTGRG